MTFQIVPLDSIPREHWRSFVDECEECWLYHHPDFAPVDDPDSRSFVIMRNGVLIGGCILFVNRSGFGKVLGYRIGAAGLALKVRLSAKEYSELSEYIQQIARVNNCHAIQMLLPSLAPANLNKKYLDSHLAKIGFNHSLRWGNNTDYVPCYTTIINLEDSSEKILSELSSKDTQKKCKKLREKDLRYHIFAGVMEDSDWNDFVKNHRATLERSGGSPLSGDLLIKLRGLVANSLGILINVYFDTKCQASLLVLSHKKSGFYFASGVKPEAYQTGVAAYIHFLAIEELKTMGFKHYEIGQFYPTLKGTKINTLGEFKRMFGGCKYHVLGGEMIVNKWRYIFLDLLPSHLRESLRCILKGGRKNFHGI